MTLITLDGLANILLPIFMPVPVSGSDQLGWYVNQLYLYSTPDNDKPLNKDDITTAGSFANTSLVYNVNNSAVIGHADFKTQALGDSANILRHLMLEWTKVIYNGIANINVVTPTFRHKINDFDMSRTQAKKVIININLRFE